MNNSLGLKIIVPILVLGMSAATPIFAEDQDTAPPGSASSSMHKAGESMENAASSTGEAVKDTYHGTVTALTDTKITAKVKHALHEAELTEGGDIDVDTVAGVVTLHGTYEYTVDSSETVDPDATQVMESRDRDELTLITCYPFYFVGSAPKRFIVHAGVAGDTLTPSPD